MLEVKYPGTSVCDEYAGHLSNPWLISAVSERSRGTLPAESNGQDELAISTDWHEFNGTIVVLLDLSPRVRRRTERTQARHKGLVRRCPAEPTEAAIETLPYKQDATGPKRLPS